MYAVMRVSVQSRCPVHTIHKYSRQRMCYPPLVSVRQTIRSHLNLIVINLQKAAGTSRYERSRKIRNKAANTKTGDQGTIPAAAFEMAKVHDEMQSSLWNHCDRWIHRNSMGQVQLWHAKSHHCPIVSFHVSGDLWGNKELKMDKAGVAY